MTVAIAAIVSAIVTWLATWGIGRYGASQRSRGAKIAAEEMERRLQKFRTQILERAERDKRGILENETKQAVDETAESVRDLVHGRSRTKP